MSEIMHRDLVVDADPSDQATLNNGPANGGRPDTEIVAPEDVGLGEDEETRLRAAAIGVHQRRAVRQFLNAAFAIFAAASALPFWALVNETAKGATNVSLFGFELNGGIWSLSLIESVLVTIVVVQAGLLAWYRREKLKDWDTYKAEAGANAPEVSAYGYMQIFRLYARTKRRSTFSILFGVVWLWWAVAGFFTLRDVAFTTTPMIFLTVLMAIQLIAAGVIAGLGFSIGRSFLPGQILVYNTLILNFRAATSQTHYDRAREEAIRVQNGITRDRPWWFFRYKKAR